MLITFNNEAELEQSAATGFKERFAMAYDNLDELLAAPQLLKKLRLSVNFFTRMVRLPYIKNIRGWVILLL